MSPFSSSVTKYLRHRPDSSLIRGLRSTLKVWRSADTNGHSPYTKSVTFDRLLCGGEQKLSAAQYARHTGNFLRPSTPVSKSPHIRFLRQHEAIGERIFEHEVLRQTDYFKHAVECINTVGEFLTCTREDQVETLARQFVALCHGQTPGDEQARKQHLRPSGSTVYVRPIKHSECYEVVDGMHQLAIAQLRGEPAYDVYVMPPAVLTPLQELVLDSAYCRGNRELYQPISSPDLENWVTIRRCGDRFELMKRFLQEQNLLPPNSLSYLDVACSYGWFVRAFEQLGFEAHGGGEIDWASCEIGKRVYGLRSDRITRGELVRFLSGESRAFDVVSCLSILHHFVVGLPYRGSISAEELIRSVDQKTRKVLFFDTGQGHETWFKEKLADWDEDYIEGWLLEHTSFKKIFRLGKDRDNVTPFEDNYGRTLFACLR